MTFALSKFRFKAEYRAFSLMWPVSMQIHCNKKTDEFNSHRIGLEHQHGRRFIVLEHRYGRRDVMWKRSIMTTIRKSLPRPLPELEMFWKPAELGDGPLVTFRLITVDTSICWSLRRPLHRVVRLATSWWRRSQCCSQTWRSMLNCSCSRSLMSCSAGVKF